MMEIDVEYICGICQNMDFGGDMMGLQHGNIMEIWMSMDVYGELNDEKSSEFSHHIEMGGLNFTGKSPNSTQDCDWDQVPCYI